MTYKIMTDEPILKEHVVIVDGTTVTVCKLSDDPSSLRISIGGVEGKGDGYYFVYRGDESEVEKMLKAVGIAFGGRPR